MKGFRKLEGKHGLKKNEFLPNFALENDDFKKLLHDVEVLRILGVF